MRSCGPGLTRRLALAMPPLAVLAIVLIVVSMVSSQRQVQL